MKQSSGEALCHGDYSSALASSSVLRQQSLKCLALLRLHLKQVQQLADGRRVSPATDL